MLQRSAVYCERKGADPYAEYQADLRSAELRRGAAGCGAAGAPFFLTKNGRGEYTIVDMQDYEKTQAGIRLMNGPAIG